MANNSSSGIGRPKIPNTEEEQGGAITDEPFGELALHDEGWGKSDSNESPSEVRCNDCRGELAMNHTITLTVAPPGSDTWRVRIEDTDLIAFAGPRAQELAERSCRNLEYFLESEVSNLHDSNTPLRVPHH